MLTSRSGRRSSGDLAGSGPPSVMWLPPPVPLCRPSRPNVSVPSRHRRAVSYRFAVSSLNSVQRRRRVQVDLDHARIGRHHQLLHPGVGRWRVALQDDRHADLPDHLVEQADQLGELLQLLQRRQEQVHQAVPGLNHQRGPGRGLVRVHDDSLGPRSRSAPHPSGCSPPRPRSPGRPRRPTTAASGAPAGESPGSSTSRPRRNRQRGLAQPLPHQAGVSGSAHALGSVRLGVQRRPPWSGPPRRDRLAGRGPSGLPTSAANAASGSSKQACSASSGSPNRAVTRRAICSAALAACSLAATSASTAASSNGSASSAGSVHSGWPSVRQISPICHRGSGSPGYHLP